MIWVDAEISVAPDRGQRHHNPNSNRTAMVVAEANTMVSQFSLKKPRILFTSLQYGLWDGSDNGLYKEIIMIPKMREWLSIIDNIPF